MATFTKLYLGANAALYTPATLRGAWDDTAGAVSARGLVQVKGDGGTITAIGRAETNVSTAWDVLLYRGVSGTLAAQTISGTLNVVIGTLESNAAADFYWHVHLYVTQGDSDTPRGTLLTDYVENTTNEWPIAAAGTAFQSAQTLSSLAITAGDRLVVEIGYIARNNVTTSRTGTLNYGTIDPATTASAGDLTVGSTNVTALAGFLAFSSAITEVTPTGRVTQAPIELLSQPTLPSSRVSQSLIEILGTTVALAPPTAASAVVTQAAVEVLSREPHPLRVTLLGVEVHVSHPAAMRASQVAVELFYPTPVVLRSSQQAVEYFNAMPATTEYTQEAVEIFLTLPRPGRLIRRLRRAPHVHDPEAHRRITYARFALDLQRGTDRPTVGQGTDPYVTLRLSRDGGKTWSEPVRMHAGRLGAYTTRVIARRLGHARDAVFEVTVSDPIAWSLVQAWLDLETGTS